MNENEISTQQLEELKWLTAFFDSLEQARELLTQRNFPDRPEILAPIGRVLIATEGLIDHWQQLSAAVKSIQLLCEHEFLECRSRIPGKSTLVAKVCKRCKLIVGKPDGTPTEICEVCWAPMKFDALRTITGNRAHYFECANPDCRHQSRHT